MIIVTANVGVLPSEIGKKKAYIADERVGFFNSSPAPYPKVDEDRLKELATAKDKLLKNLAGRIKRCAQSRFPWR